MFISAKCVVAHSKLRRGVLSQYECSVSLIMRLALQE